MGEIKMPNRHEISDENWERVKDLFSPENRGEGRPSKANRVMLNGIANSHVTRFSKKCSSR
jgi:transposase